jgi:hypothetical protein
MVASEVSKSHMLRRKKNKRENKRIQRKSMAALERSHDVPHLDKEMEEGK